MAYSLETDSCILALRRFICRRGQVQEIISDNGPNYVGAERELRDCLAQLDNSKIKRAMLNEGIKWSFNSPSGTHHGGIWERLVRIIKRSLYSVLKQQALDEEGLQTALYWWMSMAHIGGRGASGRSRCRRAAVSQTAGREVWRPGSDGRDQDPLPAPTQTQIQELHGYLTQSLSSELSFSVSTGPAHRKEWQIGSQKSPDDGRPSTSSTHSRRDSSSSLSLSEDNVERWLCRELLRLSRSDSLEGWQCRPLPGQVPVEPTETSSGRTAQGAMDASPVNKSSTGKPTRKRKRIGCFLNRIWKAVKGYFCCCCHSCAVDVVEPFVPPADLEPEPDPDTSSPGPDTSSPGPDTSSPGPDTSSPGPDTSSPGPDTSSPGPDTSSPGPDTSSPGPDTSSPGPDTSSPGPDTSSPDPDTSSPDPDTSSPDPDTSSPGPDTSSPAPDLSGVEPNNDSFESLYKVGDILGCGAFGSVYRGTRKFDGKKVAIKRMRKFDNFLYLYIPGHPEPLITEVALLLMMRREPMSPYVIQLYDWFEHPRKFTLIMEFPEPCESLLDFITRHNPDVCETVARVFMPQAVLAVQHCIEHGVFHNDIHAQNFLLKRNSLDLKLIDFGCGQLFSSEGYESNVYFGRQDHCPPEVFTEPRFHAVPANVWALGVMLYEMERTHLLSLEGLSRRLDPKPEVQPRPDRNSSATPERPEPVHV
ncbi:uncharacterized protein LOC143742492 [Siphateles boraxobius]|uniref:uncharacterized protein LOC143742492 n=1 Tax=Siphateles boraxobius TaxID=180520 RepID=UPI0040634C37